MNPVGPTLLAALFILSIFVVFHQWSKRQEAKARVASAEAEASQAQSRAVEMERLAELGQALGRSLDLEAIRRAFPSVNANFRDVKTYEIELVDTQVDLQGDRATVTCKRFVRQTNRSGRPNENTIPTVFSLRRAPSGWIIEGVR